MERIEKIKADSRKKQGINLKEDVPDGQTGQTRDIVANQSGFGSGKNFERAKFISENATEEIIKDLDDGKFIIFCLLIN